MIVFDFIHWLGMLVVVLCSVLDLAFLIDERPLSLFQGSVSEWSDMRSCWAPYFHIPVLLSNLAQTQPTFKLVQPTTTTTTTITNYEYNYHYLVHSDCLLQMSVTSAALSKRLHILQQCHTAVVSSIPFSWDKTTDAWLLTEHVFEPGSFVFASCYDAVLRVVIHVRVSTPGCCELMYTRVQFNSVTSSNQYYTICCFECSLFLESRNIAKLVFAKTVNLYLCAWLKRLERRSLLSVAKLV